MKKVLKIMIIVMIALCMVIAITGCGKKADDNNKETKEEKREFSMGEWEGNVYKNDFLGFTYTMPEEWTRSTDEEIADEMKIAKDLLTDKQQLAYEASKLNNVYYLVASNEKTGDNVRVISEKTSSSVSTIDYINAVKSGLAEVTTIKYEEVGVTKEKLGNIDCDVLTEKGVYLGVTVYQKYYVYKVDNYCVSVIVTTSAGESKIDEMVACFK